MEGQPLNKNDAHELTCIHFLNWEKFYTQFPISSVGIKDRTRGTTQRSCVCTVLKLLK